MNRGAPRGLSAAFCLCVSLMDRPAKADLATAEALFREGRELLGQGKVAEACLKFAESQRQDPSPGTLLNLAACHARQGKTASAWAEFLAAKRAAQTAGRSELAEEAQRQADQVAPQRSFLTLVPEEPAPGLKLTRNGEPLDQGSFGSKLPVDPGRYTIAASAPGRRDWSGEVTVEAGGDAKELRVPKLELAPTSSVTTAKEPRFTASPPSKLPYVVGGIGLGVTAVGLVFGGLAKGKYDSATDACPTRHGCAQAALDDRNTAETFANVANVGVGVGLAAVATGVVLLLTRGSSEPTRADALRVAPVWQPGTAAAVVSGGF
jgi:hypothetical protein